MDLDGLDGGGVLRRPRRFFEGLRRLRRIGGVHRNPSGLAAGELASGGDVRGWDRHGGGPGGSSAADPEAILEGLPAHLVVVVGLAKNVFVTGGLVSDNVQEGSVDVARRRPLLAAQHGAEGQSGPSISAVVVLSGSKPISECGRVHHGHTNHIFHSKSVTQSREKEKKSGKVTKYLYNNKSNKRLKFEL